MFLVYLLANTVGAPPPANEDATTNVNITTGSIQDSSEGMIYVGD